MRPTTSLHEPSEQAIALDVPQLADMRERVREAAAEDIDRRDAGSPPGLDELRSLAARLLGRTGLGEEFAGFAIVALSNAYWQVHFGVIPYDRRLLLLPRCLRDSDACEGGVDADEPDLFHCAGCGRCCVPDITATAESLGYRVAIADGTPAVLRLLLDGDLDAILGVACLESLEKAFKRVRQLRVPNIAVPLLNNGCVDTTTDQELLMELLTCRQDASAATGEVAYLPLLRHAETAFSGGRFEERVARAVGGTLDDQTAAVSVDWVKRGGKRLRPFMCMATYLALKHGTEAFKHGSPLDRLLSQSVVTVASALEVLHKASLVHDDIEDDDPFRYGEVTLHRRLGTGTAINVGDYLVGLGYRLVLSAMAEIGHDRICRVLDVLSEAHLLLCRGQGTELRLGQDAAGLEPLAVLSAYSRKTSPAFFASLCIGAILAGNEEETSDLMRRFAHNLGVAFQIRNDLDDWEADEDNKRVAAQDAMTRRPTLLRAFVLQSRGVQAEEAVFAELAGLQDAGDRASRLRRFYTESGAFAKARELLTRFRDKTHALTEEAPNAALQDLMSMLAEVVLG